MQLTDGHSYPGVSPACVAANAAALPAPNLVFGSSAKPSTSSSSSHKADNRVPLNVQLYNELKRFGVVTGFSQSWPGATGFENQVLKRLKGMLLSPIITPLTMQWMDSGLDKPSVGQNLGRLDHRMVWRGAAPSLDDLKALKAEGVKVVMDFRYLSLPLLQQRQAETKALGLEYHNLPLFPNRPPTSAQCKAILDIAETAKVSGRGLYLHCVHGKDRTSMAFALIQHVLYGETDPQIIKATAFEHHFRPHQFPNSARWIADIYKMADPRLSTAHQAMA